MQVSGLVEWDLPPRSPSPPQMIGASRALTTRRGFGSQAPRRPKGRGGKLMLPQAGFEKNGLGSLSVGTS